MAVQSASRVPAARCFPKNAAPLRPEREFVLYWMIAARRTRSNFALERAVEYARELGKPLFVLEALRCDYRWANARLHRFALDGMAANRAAFAARDVAYLPYVEPERGAGRGLLAALAARAAVVVTDEYPCFFLPAMVAAAAKQLDVRLEAVDSNGLLPLAATSNAFPTAYAFRRFLQKNLRPHLSEFPKVEPLSRVELAPFGGLPTKLRERWPAASDALLNGDAGALARLPIDHAVAPVELRGGADAAARALKNFLDKRLVDYAEKRNDVEASAASGLSPWLHWGHLSTHDVFRALAAREEFDVAQLSTAAHGKREGWWNLPAHVESFLDELVTWRELGHVFCTHVRDYDRYATLPEWARKSLAAHAKDRREHVYSLDELERGATHDPLWNAAQGELSTTGRMHNYLRMLWGKKILEWSPSPEEAFERTIELNNRWALDGRDPNSYSGIAWCLGRFDRPWAPERPIFGCIRYMSSDNTRRKLRVERYVEEFGPRRARAVQRRLI
ncbi:MAG: deoxyribodipyrimidine photolyase [Planctomycetes bacterium]|nr:deoxyribodipyrimidine photolyase [Planctomycetota bacterium]